MTINHRTTGLGMLLGSLLLMTQAVSAATWSATPSSCTPGVESAGKYAFDEAKFMFLGNNSGNIVVRCHVTDPRDSASSAPDWNTLTLGFKDPDGPGPDFQVVARLMKVGKAHSDATSIFAIDSNDGPGSLGETVRQRLIVPAYTWDFDNYAYYVAITLRRPPNTTLNPYAWFVKLSHN